MFLKTDIDYFIYIDLQLTFIMGKGLVYDVGTDFQCKK